MTLVQVENGKIVRLLSIQGGRGLHQKLSQLGLTPGDSVRILRHAPLGGPILVDADGRSVALGRGVASKVIVEEM
ncbi:MAG: ferrous iron transport protein A [Chloroflexota bacterium]|nr:ferrous iron transport protein A [Chloroflexota bacterium]